MTEPDVLSTVTPAVQRRNRRLGSVELVRRAPRLPWRDVYLAALVVGDLAGVVLAIVLVRWTGLDGAAFVRDGTYAAWIAVAVVALMVALYAAGSYEVRRIAVVVEEFRRICHGAAVTIGLLAVVALLGNVSFARRIVLVDVASMLVGLLVARSAVRAVVRQRRRAGQWFDRVLAVGSAEAVGELVGVLTRKSTAGLSVVAACLSDDQGTVPLPVPVVGAWDDIVEVAARVDADVVAIAGGGKGARAARELGWALEGSGRALVTALDLSDVARSRIEVRPVDGAPLAWVSHPHFSGARRLVKRAVDVVGAIVALILTSPLFAVSAIMIKTTSAGPILFKQKRLGKNGDLISVLKFRTMVTDAEAQRDGLLEHNLASNLLYFKMREDPRITKVGSKLRRYSIDELPQLINVLRGSMSLVGPRPLPGVLDMCDDDYRRRLMVKPGLTGLWQVSGRNDLSAEESLRLDLYYVENWSLALDFALLMRTVWAVLRKQGAY